MPMVYIDDDIWTFDLDAALRELPEQRRQQALRFSHEQGRRESVAAYRLLQRGLRSEYGLEEQPLFDYEEGGKPRLRGHEEICFSLSHCRVAAACAVDVRPVGIDIERVRDYKPGLAAYTMNAEELRRIEEAEDKGLEFTRLWTMKEAKVKMTGSGLRLDLKTLLTGKEDMETWVDKEKGYVCTVCRHSPSDRD